MDDGHLPVETRILSVLFGQVDQIAPGHDPVGVVLGAILVRRGLKGIPVQLALVVAEPAKTCRQDHTDVVGASDGGRGHVAVETQAEENRSFRNGGQAICNGQQGTLVATMGEN